MAASASDGVRRATTFLLAVFLWLHALFFLNYQSVLLSRVARLVHFTASEVVLFCLLLILSCLSASGFWRMVRSLAYIYFFPFVVFGYLLYILFLALRSLNGWFKRQVPAPPGDFLAVEKKVLSVAALPASSGSGSPIGAGARARELSHFVLLPFHRFMLLWCVLLLVTTHPVVVWLCLGVVLVQLGRKIFFIVQVLFFSDAWLRKYGPLLFGGLRKTLAEFAALAPDAPDTKLRTLWNQLNLWRRILNFLQNPYLMARWAGVLGFVVFACIYVYISALFSFAYYGIARVSGTAYSWPDALVASLFIPFFVTELPKLFAERLLGGIHCTLVVAVGVGTIMNFLRRRLNAIRGAACELSDQFADARIHEKYLLLEQKFSAAGSTPPPSESARK